MDQANNQGQKPIQPQTDGRYQLRSRPTVTPPTAVAAQNPTTPQGHIREPQYRSPYHTTTPGFVPPQRPIPLELLPTQTTNGNTTMATMAMHATPSHQPAGWTDERSPINSAGPRSRTQQEYSSDSLTLPPIRQAVPEIDMRPDMRQEGRYRNGDVVPTIEGGDGSSPTYYSPTDRRRQDDRFQPPPGQYPQPVYQQQPMYRSGPYPEYSQPSQYPVPQYDQPPPGYGRPVFAPQEYADNRVRHMPPAPQPYPPPFHPGEYRHVQQHEVYHNNMGMAQQNGDLKGSQRKRRGNLPKETTDKLRSWFHNHLHHPYPTEDEKQELMQQTGLQMNQISNWFINARRRQLPALLNDQKTDGRSSGKGPTAGANGYANGRSNGNGHHYTESEEEEELEEDEMDDYSDERNTRSNNNAKGPKNGKL